MRNMADTRDFPPRSPGEFLRTKVLREGGGWITQHELADALRVSRFTVNQIINGHRAVTADMAVRLAYVLGTSPELWLHMQSRLDLFQAHRKLEQEAPPLVKLREAEADPPDA